ncbi:MAG: hypothetical protein ABR905_01240 [Terracidiphilus sp.]|jgi:hypothetical protein
MLALDFRILIVAPFALAEAFLLWTLWNFVKQGFRKRNRVPPRFVSISHMPAEVAAARVFNFPDSANAAQPARNSGPIASQRLAGAASR